MDKGGFVFLIVICLVLVGVFTYISLIVAMSVPAEDNVLLDGDDVLAYHVINEDKIKIVMDDGIVYYVDLGIDDVDFTVNSDIHIELERHDTRLFWWDFIINSEPIFPDEYMIGITIKLPDLVED